ncbi:MAG TPA: hypothetical protein VFO76_06040 [Candidatus Kapabacteria bacterium]|nr:hypothetical protein [Candidatus Kapabacteria bacterium]
MKLLKPSDFEPHINTSFAFANESEGEPNESDLILRKVQRYNLRPVDGRTEDSSGKLQTEPFTLFFEGDHATALQERVYKLTHAGFPDGLELFLSCKGSNTNGSGLLYEAVFG